MDSVFHVRAARGSARLGFLRTAHGEIETPAFLPVATQAAVKALSPQDLRDIGCRAFIANTYHLALRPGIEAVERMGGLHRFMAWDGPIVTDSSGFQVFSLGHLLRISDEGVTFRSHLDGAFLALSPESAVQAQERLGADILLCLDQPVSPDTPPEAVREATARTHRWAERCLRAHTGAGLLFGVVQGGFDEELRRESARTIAEMGFPGIAIGGLSVGEPKETMWRLVETVVPRLPQDHPRHLLGVGSPEDLLEGVVRGIDLFDCALPTRAARNGGLYTPEGRVDILSARFREEPGPVMRGCDCPTCGTFSAAYLHHLFKARELLAYRLATLHNLRFVLRLMEQVREALERGDESFRALKEEFLSRYRAAPEEVRMEQKEKWRARQRTSPPPNDRMGG